MTGMDKERVSVRVSLLEDTLTLLVVTKFSTHLALNRRMQHLPTLCIRAPRCTLLIPRTHNATRIVYMPLHRRVGILARVNGDWGLAERTRRRYTIMLERIVLSALVGGGLEVIRAEGLGAVVAFVWKKVVQVAQGRGALGADVEDVSVGRRLHGGSNEVVTSTGGGWWW